MSTHSSAGDVIAVNGEVNLAGSVWLPRHEPRVGVLMFPGSGPADRHNDALFAPIRGHLIDRGIAVASFDKRGVGGSEGDWRTGGLDVLAADAVVEMRAFRDLSGLGADRIGLLGHSQGGWVVLEAAATDGHAAFVICHSGPGVSVGDQVRYAVRTALAKTGAPVGELQAALELYDEGMDALRRGQSWESFAQRLEEPLVAPRSRLLARSGFSWPTEQERFLLNLIVDYDPAAAMRRLASPVLALFGALDALVPVSQSVEVFERELGQRGLLTTLIFPEADHRMQTGRPPKPVPGYFETVARWILDTIGARVSEPE